MKVDARFWERLRFGTLILALCMGCSHRPEVVKIDQFLPSLNLPSVGAVDFQPQQLRERVVMVTFFATWCIPCLAQIPLLQLLHRRYASEGFTVVAVGMDLEGSTVLAPFVKEYELGFPVLLPDDDIRKGQSPFGPISSLPANLLFGGDGRLVAAFAGLPVAKELEEIISRELRQSAPR